jgi:hypothetical protein
MRAVVHASPTLYASGKFTRIWANDGVHLCYRSLTGFISSSNSRNGPAGLFLPVFGRTSTSLTAFENAFAVLVYSCSGGGTALLTIVQANSTKGECGASDKSRRFFAAVALPTFSSNRSASSLTSLNHGSL